MNADRWATVSFELKSVDATPILDTLIRELLHCTSDGAMEVGACTEAVSAASTALADAGNRLDWSDHEQGIWRDLGILIDSEPSLAVFREHLLELRLSLHRGE